MLADVVAALRGSAMVGTITVAASGTEAAAAAAALALDVHLDPPGSQSLDAAVAAAASHLQEAGSLLVVMADLPRLQTSDVDEVLAHDADVVVAATRDGGTGALLRSPPATMPTAYGPRSAERHVRLAAQAGRTVVLTSTAGFEDDLDTLGDLRRLHEGFVGPATRRVLDELRGDH